MRAKSSKLTPSHILHVNGHKLRSNRKHGTREPPIVVRKGRSGKGRYSSHIALRDAMGNYLGSLVYQPDHPLNCGATVYLELDAAKVQLECLDV